MKPSHIKKDGTLSSVCFKTRKNENGLSINIECLENDIKNVYNPQTHNLAKFKAEVPLDNGFQCIHDPKSNNYSHGLILGNTEPIAKKLSKKCTLIDKVNLKSIHG